MYSFSAYSYHDVTNNPSSTFDRTVREKEYDLNDHLGNVSLIFSDWKQVVGSSSYSTEILATNNYYPFGMLMPGYTNAKLGGTYRYGYNDKEKDDDIKGVGNSYDFGARIYDTRLGRWLSLDPKPKAAQSNFVAFNDNPIFYVDPDGMEDVTRILDPLRGNEEQTKKINKIIPYVGPTLRIVGGVFEVGSGMVYVTETAGVGLAFGGGTVIMHGIYNISKGIFDITSITVNGEVDKSIPNSVIGYGAKQIALNIDALKGYANQIEAGGDILEGILVGKLVKVPTGTALPPYLDVAKAGNQVSLIVDGTSLMADLANKVFMENKNKQNGSPDNKETNKKSTTKPKNKKDKKDSQKKEEKTKEKKEKQKKEKKEKNSESKEKESDF